MATTLLCGKNAKIQLAGTLINTMGLWEVNVSTTMVGYTSFGDTWSEIACEGEKRWTGRVEGAFDKTDAAGQMALQTAALDGTAVTTIRFYVDATSYYTPDTANDGQCRISNLRLSADRGGVVLLACDLEGSGPLKYNAA